MGNAPLRQVAIRRCRYGTPAAGDTFLPTMVIRLMRCLWHGHLMENCSPLAALMPVYKYGMLLLERDSSPITVIAMPSLPWHGLPTRAVSPLPAMMVRYRCGMPGYPQGAIHFTLGTSRCRSERSQRVKQRDKVEKPLLRLKRLRRGQVALLRRVLVVDLFDLATVDAQATLRQAMARHLRSHAPQERLGRPLRL